MKYITILCKMYGNQAQVGKQTYWLTKDTNIRGKGFAILEKTWQGSYNLIKFKDIEFMSVSDEILQVGDGLSGKEIGSRKPPHIFN